jgi:hypothetical protein
VADDPLAALLDLTGVRDALDEARQAVDEALRHRALRRSGGPVAAEVALRSAVASAALEGHGYEREAVRSGLVTDPVVQGALRVAGTLADARPAPPRQALARLHVLAARGAVPEPDLGRPLSPSARLDALFDLMATESVAPALLRAAVVHGELLALRPFAGPNGVVARAAARHALAAAGFDPRALLSVEVGHLAREPEYVGAANAYATGTPDGVRSWLRHCATAVEIAAGRLSALADSL